MVGPGRMNPGLLKNKLQLKETLKRRCRIHNAKSPLGRRDGLLVGGDFSLRGTDVT